MKKEPIKNPSSLLEVERLVYHASDRDFRSPNYNSAQARKSPGTPIPRSRILSTFSTAACVYLCGTPKKTFTWHPVRPTQWSHAAPTL